MNDSTAYRSFRIGDMAYGIDSTRVSEIRSYQPPAAPIDNAPSFVLGVVNLRGTIVPIVDLRLKFGSKHVPYNDFTVVLVLNVCSRMVGTVVDGIGEIVDVAQNHITPAPARWSSIDNSCLTGVCTFKHGEGVLSNETYLTLLDIEALMNSADMGLMH